MDEQVEEQVELKENWEEYEVVLQEYLDGFGFEDSSFFLPLTKFLKKSNFH